MKRVFFSTVEWLETIVFNDITVSEDIMVYSNFFSIFVHHKEYEPRFLRIILKITRITAIYFGRNLNKSFAGRQLLMKENKNHLIARSFSIS